MSMEESWAFQKQEREEEEDTVASSPISELSKFLGSSCMVKEGGHYEANTCPFQPFWYKLV